MDLELKDCTAELKNLNVRTEQHGEGERVLGTDLKLSIHAPITCIAQIMGQQNGTTLADALYDKKGTLLYHAVESIGVSTKFEHYEVDIAGNVFKDVDVNNFALAPQVDHIELNCRVQLHPSKGQMDVLTALLCDGKVKVGISPMQGELDV